MIGVFGGMPNGLIIQGKQKTKEKTLAEKLQDIEDSYKDKVAEPTYDLPEDLGLSEIEYVGKTDDEIKAEAENSVADYKIASVNQIEGSHKDGVAALEKSKEGEAAALVAKEGAVENAYEQAKESASNEVLRRGLARSSIAVLTVNEYDSAKAAEKIALNKEYEDKLLDIGNKIEQLAVDRDKAMRDLDISLAAKIAIKISDLETEREEKKQEAIKYNNTVREKEKEYAVDRLKAVADLTGANYDNLVKEYKAYEMAVAAMMEEKYNVFIAELNNMSRADALKALESNSVYREHLTMELYNKLRLEQTARSK